MRLATPYKHRPEPRLKQISTGKKRKSPEKTPQSGEFQRVPRLVMPAEQQPGILLGNCEDDFGVYSESRLIRFRRSSVAPGLISDH